MVGQATEQSAGAESHCDGVPCGFGRSSHWARPPAKLPSSAFPMSSRGGSSVLGQAYYPALPALLSMLMPRRSRVRWTIASSTTIGELRWGVCALYDWCWGADDQWLYCETDDRKLYSHDHGHFLPGGPDWSEATLLAQVDQPHPAHYPTADVDSDELKALSEKLETPLRASLVDLLMRVPAS